MKPRSKNLLDKANAALLAAVEIYNKPVFPYREDTFSILALNAWELLIKARILQLSGNKLASILEYEKRRKANGDMSEKAYRRRNRAGNLITVGIFKAFNLLESEYGTPIDAAIRQNLELLLEYRSNAVHLVNADLALEQAFHEIAAAAVLNFVDAVRQWFGVTLTDQRVFLMPLAFISGPAIVSGKNMGTEETHLFEYFKRAIDSTPDSGSFTVSQKIELTLRRGKAGEGAAFYVTKDPNAVAVQIDEADIRDAFPWEYDNLVARLRNRYDGFKANNDFHVVRKSLEGNLSYCRERLLDPAKPDGIKKRYYSPNIVKEFDAHYRRRKA